MLVGDQRSIICQEILSQIGDEGPSARTSFRPQPNGHVRFGRNEKEMMR